MKRIFLYLSAAALLFTACERGVEVEPAVDPSLIPLNIDGSISQVHTKATAAGFVDKDALGLFAVNYSEGNTIAGTLAASGNQADNVKYVFDESAYKWNPVKSVYYKDVNTNVDLYLYYPYQSSIGDVNAAGFEVQKDQSAEATATALSGYEASDFLWGMTTGVVPTEAKVAVSLSHKMSAVNVTLVENNGFDEGEFESLEKSIILMNTTRKATINYATGEVTALGAPQLDGIVMCPQEDGTFRAVVVPQTVEAGVQLFAITIDGVAYSFRQGGAATAYQSGKQMNVTINISKKTPTGELELNLGDVQISAWQEDRNTHGGEARQYYVVNVGTPGTLQSLIEAAGKNPAKIKNLKVTGTITTSDFDYMRNKMSILEAVNLKETRIVNAQTTSSKTSDLEDDVIPYYAFYGKKTLYYFTFPEKVTKISSQAFERSGLSGMLIIPDDVTEIGKTAFELTNISGVVLSSQLSKIGSDAFSGCSSCVGELQFPSTLEYIGGYAFKGCNFSGRLVLPHNISYIGNAAFQEAGSFTGDLTIPASLTKIYNSAFGHSRFSGSLIFEGEVSFGYSDGTLGQYGSFENCGFTGELVIPEGVTEITNNMFMGNRFYSVTLPSTLKKIGNSAFYNNSTLMGRLTIPEGVVIISGSAFSGCGNINYLELPSTLQTIQASAFSGCYYISGIVTNAVEPPTVASSSFSGVGKNNFTVEVPAQSLNKYQTMSGWSDFRRISAHYDFSMSRQRMRALNASLTRTYILRAPANYAWSVDEASLPDWVTVSPMSGVGKTDVVVSVSTMPRTSDTFEVNEGAYNSPKFKQYKGRKGEIVFNLDDKDYSCSFEVEQYDSEYSDGDAILLQSHSVGNGIDIVFVGEGYDAKDIVNKKFTDNCNAGYTHFFDIEPYKSYKEYFNVSVVISMSDDSGIGTENTVVDTKFGTYLSSNRIFAQEDDPCFAWAKRANASMDLSKSLVIMLMNTSGYEGVTKMYGDGSALAICPVSTEAYPYDFRGIIQHEAGGHGFGKLGDEYIYHGTFIQNCGCNDGCDHPTSDDDVYSGFGKMKSRGWYRNLSMNTSNKDVPWAHLIYNPQYSDYVDTYEGGYMHARGVYRSEATSCMNNNIPYFSAISRQAIVERIMDYAGEEFTLEKFYANDKRTVGPTTKSSYVIDRTFGVDPKFNRGSEHGSVIYMGDHPNVK